MSQLKSPLKRIFTLGVLFHRLSQDAERKTGLTLVQWCVLNQLVRMPVTSAQKLAEALRIHPSTLTEILKRLSRRGLLLVAQDPRDSRKRSISVTRKGVQVLLASSEQMSTLEAALNQVTEPLGVLEEHISSLCTS